MSESTAQMIRILGYLMLGTAAVVLVIALTTLYQVFFSPDSVPAVAIVRDFLAAEVPLLTSDIRGELSSIDVDPSARLVLVYFVGAIVVIALSSVVRALVALGLQLVRITPPNNGTEGI